MKQRIIMIVWLSVWVASIFIGTQSALAEEGFLDTATNTPGSIQEMLPPEAVYEGGQVLHKITSEQENLHLLAGYYFGNPRLWKQIYEENRSVIKNPNQLPVGDTLQIQVGENWKPKFSYSEFLQLATRNGEWKPGQTWQRARMVSAPDQPPAPTTTPLQEPASAISSESEQAQPEESPPESSPEEQQQPPEEQQQPPEETSSGEESTEEESAEEESAEEPAL